MQQSQRLYATVGVGPHASHCVYLLALKLPLCHFLNLLQLSPCSRWYLASRGWRVSC